MSVLDRFRFFVLVVLRNRLRQCVFQMLLLGGPARGRLLGLPLLRPAIGGQVFDMDVAARLGLALAVGATSGVTAARKPVAHWGGFSSSVTGSLVSEATGSPEAALCRSQ